MNKTGCKVILNSTDNTLTAVAGNGARGEINAPAGTAVSDGLTPGTPGFRMRTAAFSVLLAAAAGPAWAAGIQADTSAPSNQQPTVLQTANGLPQVNIQTPTAGGVSVNQYRQFDVDRQGAVLNNSRRTVQTRQAGWIQGNPWLARGEAKVIVNQVNSADPSLLGGYIEVAGRRAEVVLANPAGIQANGGGFIHASGVTLSTGRPLFDNGRLSGFRVRDGNISINGGGLDTAGADYTRILARTAQIHAGVWAQDLSVVAGANDVAADGRHTAVSDGRPAPAAAVDTAQLGGMYAGRITLIATGRGSAAGNAGQIFAAAGGVTLSADGKIGNSGSIVAADSVQNSTAAAVSVQTADFANSGTVSSQGETGILTRNLDNSGLITSAGGLRIRTQNLDNRQTLQGARLDMETRRLDNSGRIAQTGMQELAVAADSLINSGLTGQAPEDGGSITAGGGIGLSTQSRLPNTGKLYLTGLNAQGSLLDNRQGTIITRRADITAQTWDNRRGSLQSAGSLHAALQNLDNRNGRIAVNQNAGIRAQNIANQNGQIDTGRLNAQTARLDNTEGRILSGGSTGLHISDGLDNRNGLIAAAADVQIQDSGRQNLNIRNPSGEILAGQNLGIQAGSLAAQGILAANRNLAVRLKNSLTLEQDIRAGESLTLKTEGGLNNSHTLEGGRSVLVEAANIDNTVSGRIQSGSDTRLKAADITNRGLINSNGLTLLKAGGTVSNTGTGRIYGDRVAVEAEKLLNRGEKTAGGETKAATVAARRHLAVGAGKIGNQDGAKLSGEGSLNIGGRLDNHHQASGTADSLVNAGAVIEAGTDARISVQSLQNVNAHFELEEYPAETGGQIKEYARAGEADRYREGRDGHYDNSQGKKTSRRQASISPTAAG
ncbi:filamentous hemagglutinin N-terminal domain-containing protein [Neisseria leonii]|uniref:Filamentous hemagglutinin N-terminal domain-containing protein n=1 Tax=Neisseria leonii TaxID=2995413 RepID=A0A9X4IDX3_9NEIS|nr:filamentous hemagglutinin N-terminal domain-containing protein [Neisseria sp. 51.81]MDD9327627.1 filamentous hemagglutinin N-terminal domain-containing protein [Neisseria sp. 51.81]